MSLGKELEKLKWDKRMTEWHVNHGKLSKDELKKYLESLPDLATNVDSFGLAEDRDSDDDGMPTGDGEA